MIGDLRQDQGQLDAVLDATARLVSVGSLFLREGNLEPVLCEVVEAAIDIAGADFGNIQILDAESAELRIAAHKGFTSSWVEFWNRVSRGKGTCGTALERGERVIVEDVEHSPIFAGTPALQAQLEAGVRAVQSTPLLGRAGKPIGILSTHWKSPTRPSSSVLRLLDLLARQAADILESAATEAALRRSEQRFRALTEATSEVLYRMSPDWVEMRQLHSESFLANTDAANSAWIDEYIHPDDQPHVLAAIGDAIRSKGVFELEHRVKRAGGGWGWTLSRAVPLKDEGGEIIEWFGAASDVTARKQAELALEQVARELREARVVAESASEAKSDFLSSVSHELRTPLNAILGFTELLLRDKKEPLSDRHRGRALHILDGGRHLLRLIDDILDLSRIERGGISISVEPVSVAEVVAEVCKTLEPMAVRQGVEIVVEPAPADLPAIAADRTRFAQILMNLGSNAVKYNRPSGKVTFAVSPPSEDMVRVTVRDTGIGIPLDQQQKLFQPFQRAGQEAGPIEGTGIGLVITRRIAEMMRGRVDFRSVSGEGSAFWVDMPMHRIRASAPPPAVSAMSVESLAPSGRRLVLYVEDNPANLTFMRDLVDTFENIDLIAAQNAETGVEIARQRLPDVILMDINLPGMSGLAALRELRAVEETKNIPVIALTAAASEQDRQRGVQSGFFRYLAKPVKVDELVAALALVLER